MGHIGNFAMFMHLPSLYCMMLVLLIYHPEYECSVNASTFLGTLCTWFFSCGVSFGHDAYTTDSSWHSYRYAILVVLGFIELNMSLAYANPLFLMVSFPDLFYFNLYGLNLMVMRLPWSLIVCGCSSSLNITQSCLNLQITLPGGKLSRWGQDKIFFFIFLVFLCSFLLL